VFVPLCFAAGVLLCRLFTSKVNRDEIDEDTGNAFSFLNSVSLCALALTIVFIFNKYRISTEIGVKAAILNILEQYSILALPLIIVLVTLVYIKRPFLPFDTFRHAIYVSLGLALFVNFIFRSNSENLSVPSLRWFYIVFAAITALVLSALRIYKFTDAERLKLSYVPLSFGMLFAGFALEFCNILNQHGVFIENRLFVAKLTYWFLFGLSVLLFSLNKTKFIAKLKMFSHWESISVVGLLVSLYYFTVIPPLQIGAGVELFEQANHGMLANDVLAWGKIPIVNSFDGHMLAHSLGMLVYGFLNGDVPGASYYSYGFVWLIPQVVCLFLVYKRIFGKDFAFFFMLIAPAVNTLGVGFGIVSVVALLYAVRKRTFGAYLWLLFSVVLSTVYEAPTGLSYGGGALLVAVFLFIAQAVKERKFTACAKAFAKAFGAFVGIMAVSWVILCSVQNVNPIKRAIEFIGITQSTNTWAYANMGDNMSVTFSLLYSVLPLMVVTCLICLIVRFQNTPAHIASAALLLAYIINFTRALGRHSLAENQIGLIMWTSALGIALFAVAVLPKRKHAAFIVTGVFVMTAIFNPGAMQGSSSIANAALITASNHNIYYNGASEKTIRVDLSAPLNQHKNVLNMINSVIPQGETYFDLSSQTMLYALSGREKPVYINQSALHLSGEYTQERFIEEVENYDGICDFALLTDGGFGTALDGVATSYRYYKVYEYLYENFRPLCKSSDSFALWVRKDRYDGFSLQETEKEYATTPIYEIVEKLNGPANRVEFDSPLQRSSFTDENWTNGVLNSDPNRFLLEATDATELANAKVLYAASDSANVTDVYVDSKWIRITTDKAASIFDGGIVAADVYENRIVPIGYDCFGSVHTTDLGQIPYIWGQYDNKKAWNNTVVREYETGGELPVDVQQKAKYALLTFNSPTDGNAALTFQNAVGESISNFNFTVLAGHNRYIVRVSTDWWWNSGNIASFTVNTDIEASLQGVKYLVDD
jgi:hypothetical protein